MVNRQVYDYIKLQCNVASDYYPECLGNCYVINAPMMVYGAWSLVKGFMDEKTRSKIEILGKDYLPTLAEHMDIDELPKFLGGKCECEGGCMMRQPGPWDDYELVDRQIRRKGE